MIYFNKSTLLSMLTVALLTACGGQSSSDTALNSSAKTAQTVSATQITQTIQTSDLLASLAVTYPNGQIQADNASQAAKELAQNPAALKLTAQSETSVTTSSQSATSPIQAQATVADYKAVTRIQNTTLTGAYFFTIYDTEQAAALAGNPKWKLEGPAFWASLATGTGLSPVHRFRNNINGSYLYTIYETEKADIQANYASTFFYEGVAWHARQTTDAGWSPLYRFRNLLNGTYLFSAFEAEKDAIVANYSKVFKLEGVAYYVRQDAAPPNNDFSFVANGGGGYYDKTECVKDTATGLIWEGKPTRGLRAYDTPYSNYDSLAARQKWTGGFTYVFVTQAEIDAATNSVGYKNAVNAAGLCGFTDWRLPTKTELLGIVKTTQSPSIDKFWFPNATVGLYWTSTPDPTFISYASAVSFSGSSDLAYIPSAVTGNRSYFYLGATTLSVLVRLVR